MASKGSAQWNGSITEGSGTIQAGTAGVVDAPYSFQSRFEDGDGTNPEELIAAAHAACYSMQLSGLLTQAGTPPESIQTDASVGLVKDGEGFKINRIKLTTTGRVPGIDDATFQEAANTAKEICPVSVALSNVDSITLDATLAS